MSRQTLRRGDTPVGSFTDLLPFVDNPAKRTPTGYRTEGSKSPLEEARRRGYEEGVQRGIEEGRLIGQAQAHSEAEESLRGQVHEALAEFCAELQVIQQRAERSLPEWCAATEEQLTLCAPALVRRLLSAELQLSRESTLAIVRQAVQEITHSQHARLRINPFDLPLLEQNRAEILAAATSLQSIEFVEDPSLLGGCAIETAGGVVDASLDRRLTLLQGELEDAA